MFVSIFDQFSYYPSLYVKRFERYLNIYSAILGMLTYSATAIIAIFFLITALDRKLPQILMNDNPSIYPVVNISDKVMEIGLYDGQNFISDDSIFNIQVYHEKLWIRRSESNLTTLENTLTKIELETCQDSFFIGTDTAAKKNVLCIRPNKYNLTLAGQFADLTNGYSQLSLIINKCVNSTNSKVICKSDKIIEDTVKVSYFGYTQQTNYLDHLNETNPFTSISKTVAFKVSTYINKSYLVTLKNIIYQTDIGLIFEDKKTQSDYIFGSEALNVDLDLGSYLNPASFSFIRITADPATLIYNRSYTKLQTVLANSGGALKALQTLTFILCQSTTKNLFFSELISSFYRLPNEETGSSITIKNEATVNQKIISNNFIISHNLIQKKIRESNESSFRLNKCEIICPTLMWRNKKRKIFYNLVKNQIQKELRYKTILKTNLQLNN
jgi:hypothetical protein